MSTLGHVLFLLRFSRDFTHSACIASFLTTSGFSPTGYTGIDETSRRETLMQSIRIRRIIRVVTAGTIALAASAVLLVAPTSADAAHTLKAHTLAHTL
jgi:hypothetical protein